MELKELEELIKKSQDLLNHLHVKSQDDVIDSLIQMAAKNAEDTMKTLHVAYKYKVQQNEK